MPPPPRLPPRAAVPRVPAGRCAHARARARSSGVFHVEDTGNGEEKMFSVKSDAELEALQKELLDKQAAAAAEGQGAEAAPGADVAPAPDA